MTNAGDGICTRTGPVKGFPPDSKSGASARFATPAFLDVRRVGDRIRTGDVGLSRPLL